MLTLKDPTLLRQQCYIGGRWRDADTAATLEVCDPASGARIGTVPLMAGAETREAIGQADAAWRA